LGERRFADNPGTRTLRKTRGTNNVLIHRSLFAKVGLFDTSLARLEDWDFFWRVEAGGFAIPYAPQAKILHIMPEFRTETAHLRKISFTNGYADASVQFKYGGRAHLLLVTLWRLGVSLARDLPFIAIGGVGRVKPLLADGQCGLWFTLGFLQGSFEILVAQREPREI
jgi:hypothetical protein